MQYIIFKNRHLLKLLIARTLIILIKPYKKNLPNNIKQANKIIIPAEYNDLKNGFILIKKFILL